MRSENLSIKTATVEIKVLRIDNHKMTKAVFRQIEEETLLYWDEKEEWCFLNKDKFLEMGISIFGYVLDGDDLVIVYSWDGALRKFTIPGEVHLTTEQFCKNDEKGREELYRELYREHRCKRSFAQHNFGLEQIFIAT